MTRLKPCEQEVIERITNFDEVSLGFTKEEAIAEASRCLQCKNPLCKQGCPVNIRIPEFIQKIKEDNVQEALNIIFEDNFLPAICGRVCPQENQCEIKCILAKAGNPIAIGALEKYAADNAKKQPTKILKQKSKKVAIIGSGPSGLTCAAELAKRGYQVKVFEALHELGGVLKYGIPTFRLPDKIINDEINYIKNIGVKFETNALVGRTYDFSEIDEEYDAIYVATGAGLPKMMNIEGEHMNNVYSANEFLTRVNLMKAHREEYATPINIAKSCVVIGGGNVAMDAARTALRLGSKVTIAYRRTEEEMPARNEEIQHAKEEGIEFNLLSNPIKIIGENKVKGIELIKMKLGEKVNGRKSVSQIEGTNFTLDCDQVIIAVGTTRNPLLKINIEYGKRGEIIVDGKQQTTQHKIFAGGDITSGTSTVITAMKDGKVAANAIDNYLR